MTVVILVATNYKGDYYWICCIDIFIPSLRNGKLSEETEQDRYPQVFVDLIA
jgi:hypothetical protein